MSVHSTIASSSVCASITSARRWRWTARPAGPSAAQSGKASAAAATARSASRSPPRAISPSGRSSIGEMSVNVSALETRRPPIQWSPETRTPSISIVIPHPPRTPWWRRRRGCCPRRPSGSPRSRTTRPARAASRPRLRPRRRSTDVAAARVASPSRTRVSRSTPSAAPSSSISPSAIGVRVQPGQTQFARTPSRPVVEGDALRQHHQSGLGGAVGERGRVPRAAPPPTRR